MQFELTEEEESLKEVVDDLGRAAFEDAVPMSGEVDWQQPWQKLTGMGFTGILVPESLGGAGGTLLDACLVAEALARKDAWVPYVGSSIVAASVLLADPAANAEALAGLASGTPHAVVVNARLALPEGVGSHLFDWRPGAVAVIAAGARPGRSKVAQTAGSDLLHPLGVLDQPLEGGWSDVSPALARARTVADVGVAAWLTGVAQAALDEAVAYAKIREQFGVPIGSFQAVQHLCADMYISVETSRSILYGAAWSVDNDQSGSVRTARAARSWCARAALRVCETSIQVLGGIGVTFEHRAHHRLRNAQQFSRVLVTPRELDRIAGRARLAEAGAHHGPR